MDNGVKIATKKDFFIGRKIENYSSSYISKISPKRVTITIGERSPKSFIFQLKDGTFQRQGQHIAIVGDEVRIID